MRRIPIVVSLLSVSALVAGLADPGLSLPAAAADPPTDLLHDLGTHTGSDRVLQSPLAITALVQRSHLGWHAPRKCGQWDIVLRPLPYID